MTLLIRWRWPMHLRQDKPMTVEKAVEHALAEHDPEARAQATAEIVGRLLTVLTRKGILLPDELVEVLGKHQYEVYHAKET